MKVVFRKQISVKAAKDKKSNANKCKQEYAEGS